MPWPNTKPSVISAVTDYVRVTAQLICQEPNWRHVGGHGAVPQLIERAASRQEVVCSISALAAPFPICWVDI